MKTDSLKTKSKKIIKIVIFFNNYRGLLLSKFLKARKYKTFNVLTKKFLNKEVLKRLKKTVLRMCEVRRLRFRVGSEGMSQ